MSAPKLGSADPDASPRIRFNLFTERSAMDDMIKAIRLTLEIYNSGRQKDLMEDEIFPGKDVQTEMPIWKLSSARRRWSVNMHWVHAPRP